MKLPIIIATLLLFTRPLLAQPVVTLSASTFYLGDAPGSYTITCPVGTSAAVNALTKIANVPLFNPTSNQYGVGVTFSPPASSNTNVLVGTLPQSTTLSVMGGNVAYVVGVLAGVASCNAVPAINTTSASFTLTLGGMTRTDEQAYVAQRTWALKTNSVKLPQLTTAEQTTLPPQQPGNVVFNTDQKQVAVHNGSGWQYLASTAPEAGQFQNERAFQVSGTWTVPASVTHVLAEVWGGGAGGSFYGDGYPPNAIGGGAGGYTRGFLAVTPGGTLTLVIGAGGQGGQRSIVQQPSSGSSSQIVSSSESINSAGGVSYGLGGSGNFTPTTGFGLQGGNGNDETVSYAQSSATDYVLIVKCGNGGTAYGAQPGGIGSTVVSKSGVKLYETGLYTQRNGSFPGGGGGAAYDNGGNGAKGLIVLHW